MPIRPSVTDTCHHRPVIRHIVLFAFKESIPESERASVLADLSGLRSAVPSLRSLEVGANISPARAQGYTHILVETFDDRAGLAEYATHPAHLPVLARIREAAAQLIAVDLEA